MNTIVPTAVVDSVTFRVVYDVRHSFPELALAVFIPLIFVLVGVLFYRQRHVVARFGGSCPRITLFGIGFMVVGGLAAVLLIASTILPDVGLRIALADGHYQIHDGVVTDFVPGDIGDHRSETWTLITKDQSVSYSYSPSILDRPGYNLTAAHGGQIRNGLRVRVWDVGGDIARLEVAP